MAEGLVQFLCVFLGFLVGTLYAGKAMRKCIALKLYNEVNDRSSHKTPTPRGGGYAFVVLTTAFALVWLAFNHDLPQFGYFSTLIVTSIFVAYLGWMDDRFELSAKTRLLCHVAAAAICTYTLPTLLGTYLPFWLEKTLIVMAWVWFTNLYNFMDGIDGLAAVQAAFMAIFLSLALPQVAPVLLVLASTVLGILRFNWHPARVFMGDVGSTYLGFIFAGFMFYGLTQNFEAGFWTALIISAVFIFDSTFTLVKRLLQGKLPWQAHREHFYQRAVLMGMSHDQVVKRVILLNSVLFMLALFAFVRPAAGLWLFTIAAILLAVVAVRIRYLEGGLK